MIACCNVITIVRDLRFDLFACKIFNALRMWLPISILRDLTVFGIKRRIDPADVSLPEITTLRADSSRETSTNNHVYCIIMSLLFISRYALT